MEKNNLKHNNLRMFKKLRTTAAAKKRHFKIELHIRLTVSRLFHVHHVVQNRRSPFSLASHEWFSRMKDLLPRVRLVVTTSNMSISSRLLAD